MSDDHVGEFDAEILHGVFKGAGGSCASGITFCESQSRAAAAFGSDLDVAGSGDQAVYVVKGGDQELIDR